VLKKTPFSHEKYRNLPKTYLLLFICALGIFDNTLVLAETPTAFITLQNTTHHAWPAEYTIEITPPQDHHAYLNTGDEHSFIPITLDADQHLANAGLSLTLLQQPKGHYDELVKAQVLRAKDTYRFSLIATKTIAFIDISLAIKYQLCNDITHVCYRPKTSKISLPLPPLTPFETTTASVSFTDQLLSLFKQNQHNTLTLFCLMLLAGLLSVATPCVYPMLPITSMFIVNRAQGIKGKDKQHALVYLLGIIGTYTILGLIAGMTGGAFNSFMQSAWVNLAFALFFTAFALALLGFYELSFMQNEVYSLDHRTSQVKGLTGTWLIGSIAGLVISPCVGPIVFALLLHVADTIADKSDALAALQQQLSFFDRLSIAASGSIMMAGFGVGVGLPFFIVSTVKFKKLPKAGYWMNKIKYAFGFIILYFAYSYFEKAMGVLGISLATSHTFIVGLLAIWFAVVHGNILIIPSTDLATPLLKIRQFANLLSLLVGGWLVIASLQNADIIKSTNKVTTNTLITTESSIKNEAGIPWQQDFTQAQKLAKTTGKPIFIDFYASWCANCLAFKKESEHNAALNEALRERAIPVQLVDKSVEFERFKTLPEHRSLKIGLPYFAILTPDGELSWSTTDYQATEKMISILNQWHS
jgi:thiol:disulfide interchange protein DsbD